MNFISPFCCYYVFISSVFLLQFEFCHCSGSDKVALKVGGLRNRGRSGFNAGGALDTETDEEQEMGLKEI